MKFRIEFERTFPHPVTDVWRALTDSRALGEWLMENDFVAEPGRDFRMWCKAEDGTTDVYLCSVLALEPPRRMRWSWVLEDRLEEGRTIVEFLLEEAPTGTRLTIRHTGDRDPDTVERFKGGWPVKLDQLGGVLSAAPAPP